MVTVANPRPTRLGSSDLNLARVLVAEPASTSAGRPRLDARTLPGHKDRPFGCAPDEPCQELAARARSGIC